MLLQFNIHINVTILPLKLLCTVDYQEDLVNKKVESYVYVANLLSATIHFIVTADISIAFNSNQLDLV